VAPLSKESDLLFCGQARNNIRRERGGEQEGSGGTLCPGCSSALRPLSTHPS
jgi:hypothetical protein